MPELQVGENLCPRPSPTWTILEFHRRPFDPDILYNILIGSARPLPTMSCLIFNELNHCECVQVNQAVKDLMAPALICLSRPNQESLNIGVKVSWQQSMDETLQKVDEMRTVLDDLKQ